jgi:hypothetical protein
MATERDRRGYLQAANGALKGPALADESNLVKPSKPYEACKRKFSNIHDGLSSTFAMGELHYII